MRAVVAWRDSRRRAAPATQRLEWGKVRLFCRWLNARGYLAVDPCTDLPAPKLPRLTPRAIGGDDIARLIAVLPDERARVIVALMAYMGLRRGEVIGLDVRDWDRRAEVVTVRGKGGHVRVVPVPSQVRQALGDYLRACPATSGPLVRSERTGRAMSGAHVGRLVAEWMRAAGLKHATHDGVSPHALRHSFAHAVYGACGDLRTVQSALGHASISSTAIYMRHHDDIARIRAAMADANG